MNDMRCPLPPWNKEKRQGWNILHMRIGLLQCQPWSLHTHAIWGCNVTLGRMEGICQCKRILCSSEIAGWRRWYFCQIQKNMIPTVM
jgi:hypothetical protein